MLASVLWEWISSIFGIDSLSEDLVKYLVYTGLGAIFYRLTKLMNGWKGWKTSRKKEVMFWATSLPMMFAIVSFAAGLGEAKGGKFKAGLIYAGSLGNPVLNIDPTNAAQMTIPGIGGPKKMDEKGVNLFVILKIDNIGPPSTAWSWKARIVIPGGTEIAAAIPGVLISSNSTPIGTLIGPYFPKMEDNLVSSMALTQLAQGGSKIGWLLLHIGGITQIPENSRICISFQNVFGKETKIEHPWEPGK